MDINEWNTREALLILTNDESAYNAIRYTLDIITIRRELIDYLEHNELPNHISINFVDLEKILKHFVENT